MSGNPKRAYVRKMPSPLRVGLGIVAAVEVFDGVVTLSPLRAGIGAVLAGLLIIEWSIPGGPVPPCSKEHR